MFSYHSPGCYTQPPGLDHAHIGGNNCHTIASYRSHQTHFPDNKHSIYQGNSRCHPDSPVSACSHCHFLAVTRPHRAATRSQQPAIDLRSHHVLLPLVTRPPITAGGYLGLIKVLTRSVGVYLGLTTSPHMVSGSITSPHKVTSDVSRANNKSPHKVSG